MSEGAELTLGLEKGSVGVGVGPGLEGGDDDDDDTTVLSA